MDIDAWAAIGSATAPSFSRDGGTIFHLRATGGNAGLAQAWAMDADGANARRLSDHDEKVAILRRAPTDDRLIWGIDAGGDERQQLWLLEPGGTPRPLTAAPVAIHDFGAFSPDGARIAYAANDRDETVFDVLVMDLAGGAPVRLWQGPGILAVTAWRADGGALAVIHDHATSDQRLYLLPTDGGAPAEVPHAAPTRYAAVRWTADGDALLGLTDAGGANFMRLCRIDPASGAVEPVFAAAGRDVEAWALAADGVQLATIENDRGYAVLRAGALGTERPAVGGLPAGIVADLAWSADSSTLAFTAQGPTTPAGIWLWRDGAVRPVFQPDPIAEAGLDPAGFVAPTLVEWPSFDGLRIPAWYALPATPPPAGGYPAVVWVHGGPSSQTRANFRPDMQMLLALGYAVLMPNIRGSTGYGRATMEADEFELRPDCLRDLEAGHAWLAARPEIDAARIAVMGQSYGGWVVLAAITLQPALWRAAIDYYGISDYATLLATTGRWRWQHRAREYGFPGTHDALFAAISPLRHVANVQAPLLVLHADRDPRVPMSESDQFVAALAERQHPVRYERIAYAGHGFLRADHRRRAHAAVAAHLAAHL
jgi:dipeptidyl aminopeptidase/acylaminoacyl peptidase